MRSGAGIVSLGVVLTGVFIVAAVLIGSEIGGLGNRLADANMQEACRYRAAALTYEFRKTRELQDVVGRFFREDGVYKRRDLFSIVETLQQADVKLSRIWFFEEGADSLFVLERKGGGLRREVLSASRWPHLYHAMDSTTADQFGGLFRVDGVPFWTTIERVASDSGHVFLGFDVLLTDLHAYFSDWKEPVNSYVFILNEEGILLSHPDERLLGRRMSSREELDSLYRKTQPYGELSMTVYSEFLSCPVYRVYYPFVLGQERWFVVVNIPQFATQEILADFHRYTVMIAVLTICILGVLLFYAQGKWRKENRLRRKVEQESMELRLQQLKNQLNPHFLFNSFNSLSALISTDATLAKEFVLKLSKVYRYLLEKRNTSLAIVGDELDFTCQYYFLQRIRFGEHLTFDVQVDDVYRGEKIPAMSLQTLVENAIKHNQITKTKPLAIKIYVREAALVVENNYQPRVEAGVDSMGIGLERIAKIYEFYSSSHFEYALKDGLFVCKLPFLRGGL